VRTGNRIGVTAIAAAVLAGGDGPLRDAPVAWYEDDRRHVPEAPAERRVNVMRDGLEETLYRPLGRLVNPGRLIRRIGTIFGGDHVPRAANINALDEVPNSTWFTNRMGLFPMSPEQVARGPTRSAGPDRGAPLVVVSAKTEGVTPGFNVRDARGDVYVVKFDPRGFLGMTSAAGVITGRILHAAGYNVPEDFVIEFDRQDLLLADGVEFTDLAGVQRVMTDDDLDAILNAVDRLPDGRWLALASRFLEGTPIGPFSWTGRRKDDPNDRVPHEDRRELRGLRVLTSWLCHFDAKQGNTLDVYVEDAGARFVRHYLIDFASTLGAGAGIDGPFPTACFEYQFDFGASLGRVVTLGLREDPWRRVERPADLPAIGYFESTEFDPGAFKPLNPNTTFANVTDRDGYWAAKIVSAFTDEQLEAVVAEGRYRDAAAAAWIVRMLAARRDAVARHWFDRVPPLDYFNHDGGTVRFRDLGVERGIYSASGTRYRARVSATTPRRRTANETDWLELEATTVDLRALRPADPAQLPFAAVKVQVNRGRGWSRSTTAYMALASGRVVAVER
jgi:hypothetical protein